MVGLFGATSRDKYEFGNLGEKLVADFLKKSGHALIASYDFSGDNDQKAPMLMYENHGCVIPDLDVCKSGNRFWVEVKTYKGPAFNRKHSVYVHGIKRRLWSDYEIVSHETSSRVLFMILEYGKGALLSTWQDSIRETFVCQCGPCASGASYCCKAPLKNGIYWPRDAMSVVKTFTDDEMKQIRDFFT